MLVWRLVDGVRSLGPDIFIVLSGFLLARKFISEEQRLGDVIWRRAARILPLYFLLLAMYLIAGIWIPLEPRLPAGAGAALIYVLQNALLVPLAFGVVPIISAAWTLGVLAALYLGFPAAARLVRANAWTVRRRAVVFASAAAFLLAFPATPLTLGAAFFLSGAACRELLALLSRSRRCALVLISVAAVALALRTSDVLPYTMRAVLRIAAIVPLLFCLATQRLPPVQRLFESRALCAFGRMSYSYYLLHGCVLVAFRLTLFPMALRHAPAWAVVPGLLAVSFAASLAASAIVYRQIEQPLLARSLRLRYPESLSRLYASEPVSAPGVRPGDGQYPQSARADA